MAVKVVPVENSEPLTVPSLPADERFQAAFTAATAKPADEAPWELLEAAVVSDETQSRQLLDSYRAHISADVPKPMLGVLSHRAARFAADCFGENAPETIEVLRAVLKASPDADWAFRPLIVALTMAERWRDVLDAYDTRLGVAGGFDRRADILEEAARIAKDFIGDHTRAVGYLDQLFRLRPADGQVASSLERLLERHERWAELVSARRFRLELLAGAEARELRLRIATTLHEKLAQPDAALAEVRVLLPDLHEDAPLARLLEGLLADERATPATRLEALDALRVRYEATGAGARVPELLLTAIRFAEGERLRDLRRECGDRLQERGDVSGALDQYVALIALAPEDRAIEDGLRQLAEAARDPARLASALATAAAACLAPERRVELLVRAARVEDRQLAHPERASELFETAIAGTAGSPELRLEGLRRLEEIYDALANKPKRLDALERLAAIEPKPGGKRFTWALAAELALEIGDVDRALGAWHARLTLDPADVEALAAARDLLVRVERWPVVIDLLRRRIESGPAPHQVRADLIEMATLARERLGDVGRAIDLWREVVSRFGDDDESIGALADLYTENGSFADLAELLSRNANVDRGHHADRLARLAGAQRMRLGDARAAVDWYGRALDVDPAHEGARAGLQALLADTSVATDAARRLAAAAARTDSWQLLLDLVPLRLAGATDRGERARILEDAAACADTRAGDQKRALAWLCEALPLAGASARLEHEVLRLAEATGEFAGPARALGETIAAGGPPALTLAHLHEMRGQILETRISDLGAATASYASALALTPERLEPRRSLLRTLVRVGRFADAAKLLVDAGTNRDARDAELLPLFESLARDAGKIGPALAALEAAIDAAEGLDAPARRDLHARAAAAFVEHGQDIDAADALDRALAADPRHVPTLLRRAELQRRHPDRPLVETLSRLAAEQPDNLDYLREAADIASRAISDEPLAIQLLRRLYDHAGNLLARDARATGRLSAADAAAHAVDESVRVHVASGAAERLGIATTLLLDSARLRVPDEKRWGWLRRAAELTDSALDDKASAVRIWRLLHEQAPEDDVAREALARLYEREGRFADGVALRAAELERSQDQERRLALRLEIVRLGGLLEQRSNAPDVLTASLRERPGHAPTLRKLTDVLVAKKRHADLADIVEGQARILEEDAEPVAAAALWADAARLVESALGDAGRAMTAWQNTARLDAGTESLDALGRLALAAGDPVAAAEWLDRRLTMTEGEARNEVAARLAGAYVTAGQRHRAIACLERALGEFPRADQLRSTLAGFYRDAQSWEPLAHVLAEGVDHSDDAAVTIARASEVAEIYARLGQIEKAVPVLEQVVRLVPQHEDLGLALADGLARCGRYDDARAQLSRLVEQAGWRRTRKRAHLHQRLAEIARAQGDSKLALAEFEQASSMDGSNPAILTQLAEVAEATGDLERAERSYRTLLVQTREGASPSETPAPAPTSALALSEILLRLYGLARKRGHGAEADELLDSALAAAIKDPEQASRLQRGLLQAGAVDELARLFEKRLARAAGTPAEAEISAEMAESLRAQGKPEAAFDAQLRAVEAAPEIAHLHAPLVELARACGRVQQMVDRLLALVERRRRKADMGVASTLLLLAADVAERDFGDQTRALELHRRAEEMQPRSFEVLTGIARLAQQQGNVAECDRVAGVFKLAAAEARTPDAAAEALYRAAALELGRAETREAGIADLCEAIEKRSDLERAASLVAGAGVPDADLVKILPLYERIARQSGDDSVLLDYLERRVATPDVTHREVREAIDLAVALHRDDRLEPLLMRLLDIAAGNPDGREDATWALFELLRIKKAAGNLDAAAQILQRAAELLPMERVVPLARDLAERAGRSGNRRLGAELLERLRATAPADESIWRPLLDHYVSLRDRDGLGRLVAETLPLLPEVAQRNQLRMAQARLQLAEDASDGSAAAILQDVLLEEAGHTEALGLLAEYYERSGSEGDLIDLLTQAFDAALAARDPEAVVAAAIHLGGVLERSDGERAAAVYERALSVAPRRGELVKRVLALRPAGTATREHADLMEAVLDGETGAEAARLARELAATWTTLGDDEAARRALEKGYAQAPAETAFFAELEQMYRNKQDWAALATLNASEAERRQDADEAASLYVEAASLRRGRLADVKGSLELLRRARTRAPHDIQIVEGLSRALVAHGELGAAVAEVRAALDDARVAPEHRLPLQLVRARLEGARGDHRAAVAVLDEAWALSPEAATPALIGELEAWRRDAAAANAVADIREATLRLAGLARAAGDTKQARRLLGELVARGAADADTVRVSWELAEADDDMDNAFSAAQHYLRLAEGEAQIAAADQLVTLATRIGKTPAAAAAIEAALAAHPDQTALIDLLAPLYEQTGELGKLAGLLLDQANSNADEAQRFEQLRRAGAFAIQAQDASLAIMALNEAMVIRSNDEETALLLSDAYVLTGAFEEATALITPLIAARKGKASPALAAMYVRLAHIAGLANDRAAQLAALGQALDADKKNGELAAEVADRAEEAGDDELSLKALRLIVAHASSGPIGMPEAFLRQAKIADRRGESERAIMFARRAAQDARKGDPIQLEARAFLEAHDAPPSRPPPVPKSRR